MVKQRSARISIASLKQTWFLPLIAKALSSNVHDPGKMMIIAHDMNKFKFIGKIAQ